MPPKDDLATRALHRTFVKSFNELSVRAARAENENDSAAANIHVELSGLIASFLREHGSGLAMTDVRFLRSETVARVMQALLLRSMALSGFGDLALSMSSARNLTVDLERARKRMEDGRQNGDDVDSSSDPREHTNGLYQYVPYQSITTKLTDLPGYESQHRQLMNAYFILDDTSATASSAFARNATGSSDEGRTQSFAGANAILYGPPGTGKTTAAKAAAASLRLDFVFVNAENVVSAYRSETEKNLRMLYGKMRLLVRTTGRNVLLLLDEVDGLVKNRSVGEITSGEYSLLTKFLTILEPNDGTNNYGIFSVFTTNRLENLDDAFKRRCVSIFFGPVKKQESRVRLFHKFFDDSIVSAENALVADESWFASVAIAWVPGDYARFKRDVITPMRLEQYALQHNVDMNEFYENATSAVSDGTQRRIPIELRPVSFAQTRSAIERYVPVTPANKYPDEYGVSIGDP